MKGERMDGKQPLVNFLLAGVQKAGTTTLQAYLQEHPEIIMSNRKEVHFFNKDEFFKTEKPDYDYYHSFFDKENIQALINEKKGVSVGEATPAYIYCRDAAKRIWQYNPNMKIIIVLRNPVERAFSHWNMEVNREAETLSFSEALSQEQERCRGALPSQHYVYSYLDRGFYVSQVREYWRFFEKSKVLLLKYDQLISDPHKTLREVFQFLGVDEERVDIIARNQKKLNANKYKQTMTPSQKKILLASYKNEIKQLEDMLGWCCGEWLTE